MTPAELREAAGRIHKLWNLFDDAHELSGARTMNATEVTARETLVLLDQALAEIESLGVKLAAAYHVLDERTEEVGRLKRALQRILDSNKMSLAGNTKAGYVRSIARSALASDPEPENPNLALERGRIIRD